MTREKPVKNSKSKPVIIDDPADQAGTLKAIGGSRSDRWNSTLADQTAQALRTKNSDAAERDRQLSATAAALGCIARGHERLFDYPRVVWQQAFSMFQGRRAIGRLSGVGVGGLGESRLAHGPAKRQRQTICDPASQRFAPCRVLAEK